MRIFIWTLPYTCSFFGFDFLCFPILPHFFPLECFQVKLICHFTGKDLVKLNLVKLKNIIKMFFNMDDCFYSFGGWWKKTKRKEKRSSVWCLLQIPCEKKQGHVLFNFRRSAEIIQVPLICSNSFWLHPFRGSLWQVTLARS